jgi:hypothetical protein
MLLLIGLVGMAELIGMNPDRAYTISKAFFLISIASLPVAIDALRNPLVIILAILSAIALIFPHGYITSDVIVRGTFGFLLPIVSFFAGRYFAQIHDLRSSLFLAKLIGFLPVYSLMGGVLLWAVTGRSLLSSGDYGLTPRVQGWVYPAGLGATGLSGMLISGLFLHLLPQERSLRWLGFASFLLTVASLTRGAIASCVIFWGIMRLPDLLRPDIFRRISAVYVTFGITLIIGVATILLPLLLVRSVKGSGPADIDATSGRGSAWIEYFDIAMESPIIGCGPGASSVAMTSSSNTDLTTFRAPHNEPLHVFVDLGTIGIVALGWLIITSAQFIRWRIRPGYRRPMAACFAAVASYSLVDHGITGIFFTYTFFFGVGMYVAITQTQDVKMGHVQG